MRFLFGCLALLVVANFLIFQAILAPRVLTVSVLKVGEKGDATLIQTPNRKTILIDTGSDASILRALGTTLFPWQRKIDGIILTGTKTGMIGGLPDVTSRYRVPIPVRFGTAATPYGARLVFSGVSITVLAPDIFTISYGATFLSVSSTTPKDAYISDGKTMMEITQ